LLLICLLDGRVVYSSDPMIGSQDQQHWNTLKLREKFINKSYGIIGDGGFTFNHKNKQDEIPIRSAVPNRRPKRGSLRKQKQKQENLETSQYRVIIENVNRRLKGWRIFRETYRHYSMCDNSQLDLSIIIRATILLTVFYNQHHPLRRVGWKPETKISDKRKETDSDSNKKQHHLGK
jgi:hypothetical protein